MPDVTKHRTARTAYTARTALRVDVHGGSLDVSPLRQFLPFIYSTFPAYFPAYSVKTQTPSSGCYVLTIFQRGARGAVFRDTHQTPGSLTK